MKATKELLQSVINESTNFSGEAVNIASRILNEDYFPEFAYYAKSYEGLETEPGDIQDLLFDFSCTRTMQYTKVLTVDRYYLGEIAKGRTAITNKRVQRYVIDILLEDAVESLTQFVSANKTYKDAWWNGNINGIVESLEAFAKAQVTMIVEFPEGIVKGNKWVIKGDSRKSCAYQYWDKLFELCNRSEKAFEKVDLGTFRFDNDQRCYKISYTTNHYYFVKSRMHFTAWLDYCNQLWLESQKQK